MEDKCDPKEEKCRGRRQFLVSAGAVAGGFVLNLANVGEVSAAEVEPSFAETVIRLEENSPLNKVGGSQIVQTSGGKVIIARTSEAGFSAVSAVCPHKGASLNYDEKSGLFVCPSHGSKFKTDGSVVKGPAKTAVRAVKFQNAVVLDE